MSEWVDIDFPAVIRKRPTNWLVTGDQVPDLFAAVGVMHPEIESRAKYIYLTFNIYNATGIELERFGYYVDVSRDGMNDDDYRRAILQAKQASAFSGTPEQVMTVAAVSTASDDVELVEMRPASFSVHVNGEYVPSNICEVVDRAAVAGVRAYVTHDYGLNGFSLAGIDTQSGKALAVGPSTAMQVGDSAALGLNRGSVFMGGSFLDAAGSISGVLEVNGEYLGVADDDYLLIFSRDYGVTGTMLCGAMPK